jgi:cyanophycinase
VLETGPPSPHAGTLFAIGGAEDKVGRRKVLASFVEHAGGPGARIVVVPTASALGPEIVEVYDAVFRRLGAASVVEARPETRADAHDTALVAALAGATGVFMTGGNQLKLSGIVSGTPFGDGILAAHRRGAVVGGTSAGASILASHMVAFGTGGSTPKQRMTQLAAGLGMLPNCVIDQHFRQRNRYGRLLMLVAQSPHLLGIGIDEDTAAVITGRRLLGVVGKGAVTVVDGTHAQSTAATARHTAPLMVSGAMLHVLPAGSSFDLHTKTLVHGPIEVDPVAAQDLAETAHDLRSLAREIAADSVSPTYLRRHRHRMVRKHHDDDWHDEGDGT